MPLSLYNLISLFLYIFIYLFLYIFVSLSFYHILEEAPILE